MAIPIDGQRAGFTHVYAPEAGHESGVSWAAILAGAAGAAALSYILVILGFGLGLSAISPWTGSGASAKAIGVATILWLAFTQIAAAGMGGYLAGRLRSRWASIHTDEVYFRDTAHGFLSWAIASLVVAAFLASAIGNAISGGAAVAESALKGAASVTAGAISKSTDEMDGAGYFVDTMFRSPSAVVSTDSTPNRDVRAEAARIVVKDLAAGNLTAPDKQYLGELIAPRVGLTQQEAEQRVEATFASFKQSVEEAKATAKQAADDARKASAYAALWLFVALLIGAFCASLAATYGGRRRDLFPVITTPKA